MEGGGGGREESEGEPGRERERERERERVVGGEPLRRRHRFLQLLKRFWAAQLRLVLLKLLENSVDAVAARFTSSKWQLAADCNFQLNTAPVGVPINGKVLTSFVGFCRF